MKVTLHAVVRFQGCEHTVCPGESLTIGRHPQNDMVLDFAEVSRFHATIRWPKGLSQPQVVDGGSQNGTRVAGHPVTSEPVPLCDGAPLEIADFTLEVRLRDEDSAALLEGLPETVALYTEHGSDQEGDLTSAEELVQLLLALENGGRTGTLHVISRGSPPAQVTFCTGRIMAVQAGDARRTRALERFLQRGGLRSYRFTPDLEPTDSPMNLWLSDTSSGATAGARPRSAS